MSGDDGAAVPGRHLAADSVLAIDRPFCTHQSTIHSPLSLGRNGSHNMWCEFTSAPTTNGPLAPSKVPSDSLETLGFLGKCADVIVRLTFAEKRSVTVTGSFRNLLF
ncbi:hypothetical protein TRVL_05630 [Trypanosoma vivax]|uniref:Uncharacterized protein n=1 Tax=Trypanosoma vivax (strain Y486) TaxID=1055687 RepID=G0TS36_TRYVY|nr:hypothetical protein TRVL_05630 [Trypanosoma vivax]CCC46760.1 hypothetical protein, unlikely [Trypanosoma vivax Y486]